MMRALPWLPRFVLYHLLNGKIISCPTSVGPAAAAVALDALTLDKINAFAFRSGNQRGESESANLMVQQ